MNPGECACPGSFWGATVAVVQERSVPAGTRAFTLVELLVVIAIVAILAVLAATSAASALRTARKAQCQTRLANLGRALLLYEHDNDQTFPGRSDAPTGKPLTSVAYTYTRDILPYLGMNEEQARRSREHFRCPSRMAATNGTFDYPHYVFNGANHISPSYLGLAGVRSHRVRNPARTVLVGEASAATPFSNHPFRGVQRQPDARCWLYFVDGHSAFLPIHSPGTNLTVTADPPASYGYQWSANPEDP